MSGNAENKYGALLVIYLTSSCYISFHFDGFDDPALVSTIKTLDEALDKIERGENPHYSIWLNGEYQNSKCRFPANRLSGYRTMIDTTVRDERLRAIQENYMNAINKHLKEHEEEENKWKTEDDE